MLFLAFSIFSCFCHAVGAASASEAAADAAAASEAALPYLLGAGHRCSWDSNLRFGHRRVRFVVSSMVDVKI